MAKVGLNIIPTIQHGKPKTITQNMQDKNANEIIIITYENINLK